MEGVEEEGTGRKERGRRGEERHGAEGDGGEKARSFVRGGLGRYTQQILSKEKRVNVTSGHQKESDRHTRCDMHLRWELPTKRTRPGGSSASARTTSTARKVFEHGGECVCEAVTGVNVEEW